MMNRPEHKYYGFLRGKEKTIDNMIEHIEELEHYCDAIEKALEKACHKLWIAEGMLFKEHSKTKEQWKEWLLNDLS